MTGSQSTTVGRVGASLLIGLGFLILTASPVRADGPARLSRGLQDLLADPSTTSVNVIVQGPQAEIDRLASAYGLRVIKRLEMGAVVAGSATEIGALSGDSSVGRLAADAVVVSTMATSTQSTGANQLWSGADGSNFGGLVGAGIGIAIIDSGVGLHPDVERRVRHRVDFVNDETGSADAYGHGTHVAGIIAGSGAGSRTTAGSAHVGMAPGAEIVSLRVLGADGEGYVSDVILAIEWAIKNKDRFRLRVVNLSLGQATTDSYEHDPMALAVERAVAAGLVVVASAGNLGRLDDGTPIIGAVVSPGHTPGALTVGALNTRGTVARSDDAVASYSSRGPVGDPDDGATWELKPDLVAPGNAIVAAGASDSYLWQNYADRRVVGEAGGTYLTLSGASMATAVVSGAVAQLLQARPDLTPAQVKFVLQFTAERLEGFGLVEQGAGSLNVPLAVALAESGDLLAAPEAVQIGGEMVGGGELAFLGTASKTDTVSALGRTKVWSGRGVEGNSIVWGGRSVGGNSIVWGGRSVGRNSIVWGGRSVGGNSIVWGGRSVGRNSIVWGGRSVGGNSIVWGGRSVGGDSIVWGGRNVGGSSIVWGGRASGNTSVGAASAQESLFD